MKPPVLRFTLLAMLGVFLCLPVAGHASPPPADSTHFCAFDDYEQWRRDHPRPAAKPLATLNVTVAHLDPETSTATAKADPDFDGDGAVGFGDFVQFAAKFGLSQGDEGYDARYDLDGNGTIGFRDFVIFANAFGKNQADGPNQAPRAVENIADQDMIQGEGDAVLDVSPYFRDGDGDELTFAAVSSDESVATVVISGSTATIKPVSPGNAAVTVKATDPGGLSATQRFRVNVEAPGPPLPGPYEPLEWISVSPGRIVWRPVSFIPFRCLGWSVATVSGVTYEIHFSQWQRRDNSRSPWTDIPGTRKARKMCGYTPDTSGEYRLVMELSINGIRGRYASSNTITAICDGGECRFFQL